MLNPNDSRRIGKPDVAAVLTWLTVTALIFAVSFYYPRDLLANSCVAGPPAQISGAFCGRVIDISGGIEAEGDLQVVDKSGAIVGRSSVNPKGDFKFGPLPKGSYRVTTTAPGFREYVGEIELLSSNQASCSRPATVELAIQSCEGGIDSKDRPRHFHEPGW